METIEINTPFDKPIKPLNHPCPPNNPHCGGYAPGGSSPSVSIDQSIPLLFGLGIIFIILFNKLKKTNN